MQEVPFQGDGQGDLGTVGFFRRRGRQVGWPRFCFIIARARWEDAGRVLDSGVGSQLGGGGGQGELGQCLIDGQKGLSHIKEARKFTKTLDFSGLVCYNDIR